MTANLARLVRGNARRFGTREALVFGDRRWTHAELAADVDALAVGLKHRGLGRDDRVAVVADNVPEFLILALALAHLGCVLVPLNYRLTPGELGALIERSGARAVATVPAFAEVTGAAVGDRAIDRIALEPIDDSWTPVERLIAQHAGASCAQVERGDDDLQRIVFTSGTTTLPKGVLLSHGNVNANIAAQVIDLGLRSADRILNVAPLYHVGGTDLPGYGIWAVGGCMVLQRRFDPATMLDVIERERITGMVIAATMLDMVRREPSSAADTSSVRWLIYSQVTPALFAVAREIFPDARLIEGYGLTETCSGLTYLDAAHARSKLGSVGLPLFEVDVRIVDEQGSEVPPETPGEVIARGPKVSSGYLDDPVETARAFRDGWFHTGDIGRRDAEGYLYIHDRLKDMIRSGGENIASAEVEAVLTDHPGVLAASVVGAPHPVWQEIPTAFVVGDATVDPTELIAHARARLAAFKVPKEIYLVAQLPTNPSGKVLKRELRTWGASLEPDWVYAGSGASG